MIQSEHPYSNSWSKTWNVETDCKYITISSTKFETEAGFDKLQINATNLRDNTFSGTEVISEVFSGPDFYLSFSSDLSHNEYGFDLSWKCSEGGM